MSEESPRRAFLAGLTQPSVSALAGASLTVMGCLLASALLLGPQTLMDGGARWFAAGPTDDEAFATARALALRREPADASTVLLLGGSSSRESVTSEQDLETRLDEVGVRAEVIDLTTDAQTIIESAVLVEQLGPKAHGLIVMGMSPNRLAMSLEDIQELAQHPRLALDSPLWSEEFAHFGVRPRPTTGVPLLDQRDFWLVRIPYFAKNILRGPQDRQQHRYWGMSRAKPDELVDRWEQDLADVRAWKDESLASLGRLLDRVRSAGRFEIALLEAPRVEGWFGTADEAACYREYDAAMREFTTARGVAWWHLDREAALVPEDFRDPTHLRIPDAQQRYASVLVDHIARIVARSVARNSAAHDKDGAGSERDAPSR